MDWETIWTAVWAGLNSPIGIATVAALVLWALNKVYAAKPAWKAYEGTIITAIKGAEKMIPDDVENKGMKRLDEALRYVLQVYTQVEGKRPTPAVEASLKEGVQITHASLEAGEAL
ncbi:MAG TPA: hypothetical protein VMW52_07560 [Phycisphaerae bacterium]|nr:hypothetical protein [Phycisphaerae bacterium]